MNPDNTEDLETQAERNIANPRFWVIAKNDRLGLGLGFTVFIATIITLTSLGLLIALLVTGHEVVNEMIGGGVGSGGGGVSTGSNGRLPFNKISNPEYIVEVNPHLQETGSTAFTFEGTTTIKFKLLQKSDRITLHSSKATTFITSSIVLQTQNGTTIQVHSWEVTKLGFLELTFGKMIPIGDVTLTLKYTAPLNNEMRGFYKSYYTDSTGKKHWIAATQFEPTDARLAFPCFDEPQYKGIFTVKVVLDADLPTSYVVLSNMDLNLAESSTNEVGKKRTYVFNKTPKMSTYLVAFVVGEFVPTTPKVYTNDHSVDIRVWTQPGQTALAQFALNVTYQAITWFEIQFKTDVNHNYKLPKLDLIAIPDFSAGAMENWGLITFRDTALLVDNANKPSIQSMQRVASVVVHEMAHQWFGDYITMNWWNDLWLNEGFATMFEYWCLDALFPHWKIMDQFPFMEQQAAMAVDALASSHPLEAPVVQPGEISEIFDAITYSKGASVLRLLSSRLGGFSSSSSSTQQSSSLSARIYRRYLDDYPFGSVVTANFFNSAKLVATSYPNLPDQMRNWTKISGFPLVKYTIEGSRLMAQQERFLLSKGAPAPVAPSPPVNATAPGAPVAPTAPVAPAPIKPLWHIPLDILTRRPDLGPQATYVAKFDNSLSADKDAAAELVLETDILSPDFWFKSNAGQGGFYRSLYPPSVFSNVRNVMNNQLQLSATIPFTPADRSGFINDALVLSQADLVEYKETLELVKILQYETSYVVWQSALTEILRIGDLLEDQDCYGNFKVLMQTITSKPAAFVGWSDSDNLQTEAGVNKALLRGIILSVAVDFDRPHAYLNITNQLFSQYLNDPNYVLPGSIQSAVFKSYVINGQDKEWNQVFNKYKTVTNAQEKSRLLRALATTKEPYLLEKLLDLSLDANVVRPQDMYIVIDAVAVNPYGGKLFAWDFVRENWKKLSTGGFGVSNLVWSVAKHFTKSLHRDEVKAFFVANPTEGTATTVAQVLETISNNMLWLTKNKAEVCTWLQNNFATKRNVETTP